MRPQQAQLEKKIYFWHNARTDHIYQGAPPQYDKLRPPGYETIECKTAHEAELWSERLRQQDERWKQANDYERELIEGKMRQDLRTWIQRRLRNMSDSRNQSLNAAMLRHALKQLDALEEKGKTVRTSYLHSEGFEAGHE